MNKLIPTALAALTLSAAACSAQVEKQQAKENAVESKDVTLSGCGVDTLGLMTAHVNVTNHSAKRSDYDVEVTFENANGDQLATGYALVTNVEPGQKAGDEAMTAKESGGQKFTCKLASVQRTEALR